jgi:hypothetical protein
MLAAALTTVPTQGMLSSAAKISFSTARLGPDDSDVSIAARMVSMTCASVMGKIGPLPLIADILMKAFCFRFLLFPVGEHHRVGVLFLRTVGSLMCAWRGYGL